MKTRIALLLIGMFSLSSYAHDVLHTYPSSGLAFHASDMVKKVKPTGPNIRLYLADESILATVFIFKDTKNSYPLLEEFSEQFLKRTYSEHELHVFNQEKIVSQFANVKAEAKAYLIELDNSRCELYFASAVGNQTYLFFNLSDEGSVSTCRQSGEKLKSLAKEITASIAVTDS